MYKTKETHRATVEEYAVIDSYERRIRKLGFPYEFTWEIIRKVRGQISMLDGIPAVNSDPGTHKYIVDCGLIASAVHVCCYMAENKYLYLYMLENPLWKKIKLWKSDKYYCMEIIE